MPLSLFGVVPFDWEFAEPKWEMREGAARFSGPIIIYGQDDLDAFRALYRPVSTRVAGDPSANGTVYVDHFGPDPSQPLQFHELRGPDPPQPTMVQYTAILSAITRSRAMPGGVHFCDVEFTLLSEATLV